METVTELRSLEVRMIRRASIRLLLLSLLVCVNASAGVILEERFEWTDAYSSGTIALTSTVLDLGAQHEFRYSVENIDFRVEAMRDYNPAFGLYLLGLNLFSLRGSYILYFQDGYSVPPGWNFQPHGWLGEWYIDHPNWMVWFTSGRDFELSGLRPGDSISFSVFRNTGYEMKEALAYVGGLYFSQGLIFPEALFVKPVPYPDVVPEPGTFALISGGLAIVALWRIRSARRNPVS